MKKMILAATAVLMLGASNSYATVPVATSIGVANYTNPTTSSTRMNLYVRYLDAVPGNFIFEPATMVQIWARSSCGVAATTVTVVLHNGTTVVMKKNLDYTFYVPLIWADWTVDVNAKILSANFIKDSSQPAGCFEICGYGPDGNSLPGGSCQ